MKIGVVVTIYNVESYIRKCLDSVIGQTYKDLEIILVDDGSLDNSGLICDEYAKQDHRIRVIHKKNQGLVLARMTGIQALDTEFVSFVDGDDWIEPAMYGKMAEIIEETGADMVISGMIFEKEGRKILEQEVIPPGTYHSEEIKNRVIPTMMFDNQYGQRSGITSLCTKLFKRNLLSESMAAMDPEITYGEDGAITFVSIAKAQAVTIVEDRWYHYVIRNDSMVRQYSMNSLKKVQIFKDYMEQALKSLQIWDMTEYQLEQYTKTMLSPMIESIYGVKIYRPVYLFPFHQVRKGSRVIIYGAGIVGRSYVDCIKTGEYVTLTAWVDRNYKDRSQLQGVESPDMIYSREFDTLIIAIENAGIAKEVKKNLLENGIREDKIISDRPYRMDTLPL